jgi:iron complex transport system ATP-binding protein
MGLMLAVEGASYRLPDGRMVFRDVHCTAMAGEVTCVLGPNGVGKSTLLRCLSGLLSLAGGTIHIDGRPLPAFSRRDLGRLIALVPQSDNPAFAFTVAEMVRMGRAPHLPALAAPGSDDRAIAEAMLRRLGIAHLAERLYPDLSGGERQLVLIARALTQQPRLLILDEPTAHLDFARAAEVLELISELAAEGLAVVMTTHAPDQAFLVAARTLTLRPDFNMAFGPTGEVLTEASLRELYGRKIALLRHGERVTCLAAWES